MTERRKVPIALRFWAKVQKTETCWLWTAGTSTDGYGRLKVAGRTLKAHRVAWKLANGDVPDGLLVCHHCDTPACVRPDHLFLGTARDNNRDASAKGRSASGERNGAYLHPERIARGERNGSVLHPESRPRGDKHPLRLHPEFAARGEAVRTAKLTADDVLTIHALRASGQYQREIAARFGVGQTSISRVLRGATWKHIRIEVAS